MPGAEEAAGEGDEEETAVNVTPWPINYRGFQLGWYRGLYGFKAAWRSSFDRAWDIGHIYVDTVEETQQLAKECIDWNYKLDAKEVELGRELTLDEISDPSLFKELRGGE